MIEPHQLSDSAAEANGQELLDLCAEILRDTEPPYTDPESKERLRWEVWMGRLTAVVALDKKHQEAVERETKTG